MLRNPWDSSQATRVSRCGSLARRSSSGSGSGTSQHSSTSLRLMRAASAWASSMSRRLDGFMACAAASTPSTSPNSWTSWDAVLGPMPGTPGTLSTLSPMSACTSTTFSGGTPNFSITSAGPMGFCLIGSCITTRSPTSCIRSLSDDTMVTRPPAATAARA